MNLRLLFQIVVFLVTVLFGTRVMHALDTELTETPQNGGTLRLVAEADLRTLDPPGIYSWIEGILSSMIHHSILDYDEHENLIPVLSESLPVISPDGLTYTFHLKQGIQFSNGRELIAEDVIYSIERHFDPRTNSQFPYYYRNISGAPAFQKAREEEAAMNSGRRGRWLAPLHLEGIRLLDRYTVQFKLQEPDFIFSDIMATQYSSIVPREEVEAYGAQFGRNPVGCGPFILKEWERGLSLKLERNPHYFQKGLPYLDVVGVSIIADETTQMMMLERGEFDWKRLGGTNLLRIKRNEHLRDNIKRLQGTIFDYMTLNCEMEPFTDKRVRQAMNYAVDKQRMLKALFNEGAVARSVLPAALKGHDPNIVGYPYNPAKAKELLAEAGFPNGFTVKLLASPGSARWIKIALLVQNDLEKIGIQTELQIVSGPSYMDAIQRRKEVPFAILDWLPNFNDPKDTLKSLLSGEAIKEEGSLNMAFWSNAKVDELFREADLEMIPDRRLSLYHEIETKVVEEAPWIFLLQSDSNYYTQPRLKGFKPRIGWPQRLEKTWIQY
jgi:oligopeptide transport system substrate-binding protein